MNPLRPVLFHAGLLAIGGLAATLAWSKEKTPQGARESNVTVWNVRPTDVQKVVYEAKGKKLTLESRDEKKGERWFFGSAERDGWAPPAPDGGVAAPAPKIVTIFSSSAPATKVIEAFAPLKAVRSLGKIPEAQAAEYGFDKKETSVTVTIGGKDKKLVVGSTAPGGTDTYVIDPASTEAYVLKADGIRDLESGESRLMEHDQHAWKDYDVVSAKVSAGGKTRELVRGGPDGTKAWADPASKDKADETAGNWMQKIDKLRVNEYVAEPPKGNTSVVRVDYTGSSGPLGFIELVKVPGADGQKADYWFVTERTHLYGKVMQQSGEQAEQDVASVVK
ncbi:MAG TPA: DUF4340 domain-containing protein [Polyangiaceae bacterium]|nr:DUF4340 domain-containing protein [Polyangiaceae bacterium]